MSAVHPEFGASAEGLLSARVGDMGYIAIPTRDGFRLASAWRLSRPMQEWTEADVYGSEGLVPDEAGFRAHVEEVATHFTQRAALGRRELRISLSTPWGTSQGATIYAEGVTFHSTASHGGFKLDAKRNGALHPALRLPGGWYEEDGDWARVAAGYPDLFTDRERASADRTLRDWEPDAWEAVHGRTLARHESLMRDRQHFQAEHAADWIVISAVRSDRFPGEVETVATLGGKRGSVAERRFRVPCDEYRPGPHGFVIEPARHAVLPHE